MSERTLILLKPDALERHLAGKILDMIEQTGATIGALQMMRPSRDLFERHYAKEPAWFEAVGNNTIKDLLSQGKDPVVEMGSDDPMSVGTVVWNNLITFMLSGPVIAMILEKPGIVQEIRQLVGHTIPTKADPNSIRGRYGEKVLSARNLIHASGNPSEAEDEILNWFPGI